MIPRTELRPVFVSRTAACFHRHGFRMRIVLSLGLLLAGVAAQYSTAQDIFGRISGTVTDPTGAVVPHATITITNEETKLQRSTTAGDNGFYVMPELPAGVYSVTAKLTGFKTTTIVGNDLVAGARMTVDLTLEVGAIAETIEVHTVGETVNTTSGEISRTIDSQQVEHMALNERNYVELITLIPGAALTTFDQTTLTTGMSTTAASVNGLRADGNLFTVDGGYNLDSGSNATQLDNVGIDFVREVSIQTSNYSAEYGRNDAASVNVVTKSGGNSFHGSLFEYVRNDIFDAANPGSKLNAAPGTPGNVIKPPLRFNDFGWSVGGPIKRGKLFFFAGQEWKKLRIAALAQNLTLPTTAELAGNFSASGVTLKLPANAPAGCTVTGNVLSPACINPNGQAIANVYALMEKQAASFNNIDKANNGTFQPVDPQNWREDIIRIDFYASDSQSLYFRYLHDDLNLIDAFGTFAPAGTLPTSPTNRIRPGYGYQGGYMWTISTHMINEAKFNVSWNKQRIPPTGNTWEDSTYGFNIPLPFANAGRFPNGIPHVTFTGIGGGTLATAAPAQFTGPFFSLLAPITDISPSDNFTWQTARHTFKFGAMYARNRKDQNSRPNSPNGAINFSGTKCGTSSNPNSTCDPFADALMGNFQTFSQQSADPIGFFRFNDIEGYASDSWKLTHKLNIEYGVRYVHIGPTYTQGNNMANFDPSLFKGCTTAVDPVKNTPTSTCLDQGFVIDGLVRAGNVPSDQLGRVPGGNSPFVLAVPATSERGFYKPENLFAPRLGFAFSPFRDDKTVLRGGFGIFYDKPEGNVIFGQPGVVPFLQSVSFQNGNLSNPGTAGVPTIFGLSAVDPNFVVARTAQYSLSVQHEMPYGFLVEAAYVGNQGRHEVRQPNINVPSFAQAAANPGKTTNQMRPFLGYTDITQFRSDSNSNYNALQLSASKRKGDLNLGLSYTYSKALGQTSGINDNPEPECPFSCQLASGQIVSWRQFYYGPLSFDRRNAFVATYTYRLPFFRGQAGFLGEAFGGWEFSGITRAQSGQYLTVNGTQTIGGGNLSFSRRASLGTGKACTGGALCWFDTSQFIQEANTSAGTAPTGNIIGPGYYDWDMSLRKTFRLPREGMNLMLQADAFNVFNRTNWQNPGTSVTGGGFGLVSATNPPRNLQFGARFAF
jgi:hypothetical protein